MVTGDSFKNIGSGRYPKSRKEEQEYGSGKAGIVLCSDCSSVYWDKSWHHQLGKYKNLTEDKQIRFARCPACQMAKDRQFEGRVLVEHVPAELRGEVEQLIYNVADRAYTRDSQDRILMFRAYKGNGLEVRTSENQLALIIAKQIHRAHKNTNIDIQLSEEESVARVRVWWVG